MIDGMPEPAGIGFAADIGPHFIDFSGFGWANDHSDSPGVQLCQQRSVHGFKLAFLVFQRAEDCIRADAQHPCGVADPAPVHRQVNDLLLH